MFGKFSKSAEEALAIAKQKALELGHNYIGTEHIILGLLEQKESVAAKVLGLQQITAEEVETKIEELVGVGEEEEVDAQDFTPRTKKVLESSIRQAIRFGQSYTGTEHVLLSIIEEPNCVAVKILISLDANLQKIYEDIFEMLSGVKKGSDLEKIYTGDPMNKNDLYTFEKYSTDITKLAEENKLDPVIGREKEIERVIQILSRRTKNNPCLIGEPGVGKTAIVEGLAQLIVSGSVPETLKHKRILALDISAMVAGTKYRGEFESRIKKVIEEIKNNSNVIMFIDEIHMIIGAGSAEGSLDAANILKPSLARGELHVIGATTTDEYRKHVEKDKALERRFQPVKVEEPSEEEAIKILKGLRDKYEAHHEVKIKDSAIEAAVKLSIRYLSDRALPDKAVDVIDEASSKVKLKSMTMPDHVKEIEQKIQSLNDEKENLIKLEEYEKAGEIKKKQDVLKKKLEDVKEKWKRDLQDSIYTVTEKEVAEVIEQWTGIPVTKLEEGESQRLAKLESLLKERIIGQEEALKAVGAAIRRGRVGIKDPKRPIGSFLFLGPTGVGKTELTKALADVMFGDEKFMVRVDMSEYMEKHNVSKLIGSPPGYVGYDEGGQLTEIIRRKPYSVILFDEIERPTQMCLTSCYKYWMMGTSQTHKGGK